MTNPYTDAFVESTLASVEQAKVPLSRALYRERMNICHACIEYNLQTQGCGQCGGCCVDIRALWAHSDCPLEKWKAFKVCLQYH